MSGCLFFFLTLVSLTFGRPWYQTYIPNGAVVPDPCQPNTTWPGVGHKNKAGGGDRNPFGLAFANNNYIWTHTLCTEDSDGDGKTNGQELGDPNCTWTANSGNPPAFTTGLTHPGICEPISSQNCMMLNTWLSCKIFSCPAFNLPSTRNVTIAFPRTPVPVQKTTYLCQSVKLPNDSSFHIIGYKPNINNVNVTHHILLLGCTNGANSTLDFPTPRPCDMVVSGCMRLIGAWTVGVPGVCFSDQFGLPMGQSGFQYAVMQVHWNNVELLQNQYDSSGLMLYYTDKLRPNDGQFIIIGQTHLEIPPGQANVYASGGCVSECTMFLPHSVNIIATAVHMHLLGKSGDIRLINSNGSRTLLTAPNFDYNSPNIEIYDEPIPFSAGDELFIDCVYQSLDKNTTTYYGPATSDEMCSGFILIYPAIPEFDVCYQFKEITQDIPICPLLSFPHCNWGNFWQLLGMIGVQCNASCTKSCRALIDLIYQTGCFDGSIGDWLNELFLEMYPASAPAFDVVQNTCAPSTSLSPSTTSLSTPSMSTTSLSTISLSTTSLSPLPPSSSTKSLPPAQISNGAKFSVTLDNSTVLTCLGIFIFILSNLYK